ncbi:MAG: hypothetical protein ACI9S8_002594 [Chlamydiales bacterium]|jgi:hypothetical protein
MRQSLEQQMFFGEVDISKMQISTNSRDDIPQVLLGLQNIYQKQSLRDQVFKELHDHVGKSKTTDDQLAVPLIKDSLEKFSSLTGCSFTRGFTHSLIRRSCRLF